MNKSVLELFHLAQQEDDSDAITLQDMNITSKLPDIAILLAATSGFKTGYVQLVLDILFGPHTCFTWCWRGDTIKTKHPTTDFTSAVVL